MRGLIVDNFAGGGGASTGIEMALGRPVDIAINHDADAIAMHTANHLETLHYCESVFDVDPVQATAGQPVQLAWFSPDCKHFSKAKGGKPVSKKIRGLAWIVIRWVLATRPSVLMLENVEEFQTWGPLTEDNQPCPVRKGQTFQAFVAMLGAGVDADHPALQECCDVLGLVDVKRLIKGLGYKVEWRELRACDYGSPTIRKRLFLIARCDGKPITWPEPTHGAPGSSEVLACVRQPWLTAADCIDWTIPCPSIFDRKRPLAENTLRRIAKGIQRFVIDAERPFVVQTGYGERQGQTPRAIDVDKPLGTVVAGGCKHAVCEPVLAPFLTEHANSSAQRVFDATEPMRTQCAEVKGGHFALVAPVIARQFGKSVGHRVDEPAATVTAGGGGKSQLVSAFLAKHYGGNYTGPGASLLDPMPTVTTVDHNSLVTSNLVKLRGTCKDGQPILKPLPTITSGGLHIGEVRAFLIKYYGTNIGHQPDEPLQTITTKHRFGLVTVEGQPYQIVDIGMRMLEPHELFLAQGFPADYVIDQDKDGKRLSKAKQVARCGNAVPPQFAEALVRANLPELCTDQKQEAA